jgi:hypothetical protein
MHGRTLGLQTSETTRGQRYDRTTIAAEREVYLHVLSRSGTKEDE